jgi:hypothetical protein
MMSAVSSNGPAEEVEPLQGILPPDLFDQVLLDLG